MYNLCCSIYLTFSIYLTPYFWVDIHLYVFEFDNHSRMWSTATDVVDCTERGRTSLNKKGVNYFGCENTCTSYDSGIGFRLQWLAFKGSPAWRSDRSPSKCIFSYLLSQNWTSNIRGCKNTRPLHLYTSFTPSPSQTYQTFTYERPVFFCMFHSARILWLWRMPTPPSFHSTFELSP